MEEYGIQLAPQNIEAYDPGKRAGQHLSAKWRELFEHTRQAFLDHVESRVPHAHKAVRVKKLARAADAFENRGNYMAMADMLERIAKEVGNVHTNRREHTGKDGGAVKHEVRDVAEMTTRTSERRPVGSSLIRCSCSFWSEILRNSVSS